MDERLRAIEKQIGPAAWADRLAVAEQRLAVIEEIRRRIDAGATLSQAIAEARTGVSPATIARWIRSYAANGLLALVDRVGRLSRLGHLDPAPLTRRRQRNPRGASSFVKWVGSKQGVISELLARTPPSFQRYFEPMAGSGVFFLALAPARAVLADLNTELMACYAVVRDDVEALIAALGRHRNTSEHYHRVRAERPGSSPPVERAARFIYLNKTCFNGLYRVNRAGHFNVPFGRIAHANFQDAPALRRVSAQLKACTFRLGDFAETCADAAAGDFVYLDPPYLTLAAGRVIRYQQRIFDEQAHRRLAALVRELDRRGCSVMVSNSDLPLVRKLYRGFRIDSLDLRRKVNANAGERAGWKELLIRNYDLPGDRGRRAARRGSSGQLELPMSSTPSD